MYPDLPQPAQANARSRNAEAVTAALRAAHWDAFDWCQLD